MEQSGRGICDFLPRTNYFVTLLQIRKIYKDYRFYLMIFAS